MKSTHQLLNSILRQIRTNAVIWLVASIGLSLSATAFLTLKKQFNKQRNIEFSWVAHSRNGLLKHGMEGALEPIRMIRDNVQASGSLNQEQFQVLAAPLLKRNPGFEMLGLIFNQQNKNHIPVPVHNDVPNNDSLLAYSTLTYVEGHGNSDFKRGYPIASQAILRDTIAKAWQSGRMAVSERIPLLSQKERKYGVMACLPLYKSTMNTAEMTAKNNQLIGFVVAILRLDELAHVAISYLEPRGVDLLVLDESAAEEALFLEFYASRLNPLAKFREQQTREWLANEKTKITEIVQMADRKWSITAVPNLKFRSAEAFGEGAWVVLVAGALLTVLLVIYLLRIKLSMQERLRMSQQLKDREELFWQMTETVDDVFWAITVDRSHFLYVSPAFESIWGQSCEAVYKNTQLFWDNIHPADKTRWFNALEKAKQQLITVDVIYRIVRQDGTQRWVQDYIFPVRDSSGKVYRLVGVAEDITEKKQADDALRDSEKKLRTLFNQSPDTIMTVDKGGDVLLMNRGATLESSNSRGIELNSVNLLPSAYQKDYKQLLARAFQDGQVSYLPYQSTDSSWWEIRIVPILENAQVMAAMVISTDITEKRNLQAQSIRNARLASIGVIATGVAHDINNPNNAIKTGASLFCHVWEDAMRVLREYYHEQGDFSLGGLSFDEEGESLVELIYDIKDNSRRIESIVSNLKHLGKNDHVGLNEKVNINEALKAAAKVLGSNIRKYSNKWVMELGEGLPPVRGNLQQLEQVFINVMLNALQSLPDKESLVRVESIADQEHNSVIIRVQDQGVGIAEDNISRVTEPFFTTRLKTGGTGLGLSISSTIIENHQGSINFESTQGVGTLVTLTLPEVYKV